MATTQTTSQNPFARRFAVSGAALILTFTGMVATAQSAEALTCNHTTNISLRFTGGRVLTACPNGIVARASINLPTGARENIVRTGNQPEISTSVDQIPGTQSVNPVR